MSYLLLQRIFTNYKLYF